ncbi:UDP-glucose dehydrogenase family protein [Actinomyces sp. W5033]|uniref:UDP-glucose dehydrogenase family protein n=1 Tax=Actinomyces sp. W5033 TaxID=3446479 RepID=UPI003EDF0148
MRVTVVGCGYLGAVHAAAMSHLGHDVLGIDTDTQRVAALAQGRVPFYEPGLPELLKAGVDAGRLRFTREPTAQEVAGADVHFIAVGTPQTSGSGEADLSQVRSALDMLVQHLDGRRRPLVVGKSTVPVGTAAGLADALAGRAHLVWNPEFLREGFAVHDTLHPDRIVYGLPDRPEQAQAAQSVLDEVYARILDEGAPRILTDYATAELVKTSANAFLAMKISFINAMASMCDATGGDVTVLARALGHDARIGARYLRAGVGFGGGCLPKDIRALGASASLLGVEPLAQLLAAVDTINRGQRDRVVRLAVECCGGSVEEAAVTVLGAAFKPDSDDLRDSPALEVADRLSQLGAAVTVHDPQAGEQVRRLHPGLAVAPDVWRALDGADLVVLGTEWRELTGLDPHRAARLVARPVIVDARNALDPTLWREAGWTYRGVGR